MLVTFILMEYPSFEMNACQTELDEERLPIIVILKIVNFENLIFSGAISAG